MLSIENDIIASTHFEEVIDTFAEQNARKMNNFKNSENFVTATLSSGLTQNFKSQTGIRNAIIPFSSNYCTI